MSKVEIYTIVLTFYLSCPVYVYKDNISKVIHFSGILKTYYWSEDRFTSCFVSMGATKLVIALEVGNLPCKDYG